MVIRIPSRSRASGVLNFEFSILNACVHPKEYGGGWVGIKN